MANVKVEYHINQNSINFLILWHFRISYLKLLFRSIYKEFYLIRTRDAITGQVIGLFLINRYSMVFI